MNKKDLLASYLSGTFWHKPSTRPPSCITPQQPTMYVCIFYEYLLSTQDTFLNEKKLNEKKGPLTKLKS